jgi:hypothetical protein
MAFYNLTNITSSTNLLQMAQGIDVLSNHALGIMLYFMITILLYIGFSSRGDMEAPRTFAVVFWFGAILSLMLQAAGLFPQGGVIFTMLAALLSTGFLFIKSGPF